MAQQQKTGRPNDQKQDEWQQDLNPNPTAGQNHGIETSASAHEYLTADQIKDLHRDLEGYTRDDLRQIIVLPPGSRLEQGAKYIDLKDPERQEFAARGDMEAGSSNYYVPKTEIDYQLWNRLTNVQNPERTGQGNLPA
ncbi:MAG: hypothetical protein MUF49_02970 [Oculatellaceae cyanobacterium Prado106]|jgi:hypothetical protein|nr:hypothetical protein [Oculatellaceae cyanobacterium Prado106]